MNFATRATHDAGQGHRLLRIGNQQHRRCQRAGLIIERIHRLALCCTPHDNLFIGQKRMIKGVQGMSAFKHDVIRHIDNIVDRAHPAHGKTPLHPKWAGADIDIRQSTGRIPRTPIGILDRYRNKIRNNGVALGELNLGNLQFRTI